MPTQSFSTFEAFFVAVRHANLRVMVRSPERGTWVLSNLIANKLSVQFGQASANAIVEGSPRPGGLSIFIPTQGSSTMLGNGHRFDDSTLLVAAPGDQFCLAATQASRQWCSLCVPNEELARPGEDATSQVYPKRGILRLPAERVARFRSVIGLLHEVILHSPTAFASVASRMTAEQKLVREVWRVLAMPHPVDRSIGRHEVPRGQIIRRSMDFVDQHDGEYLSVAQLATAASVSERTLRSAFEQYFGEAPVRFLRLRTLHQVRRALRGADPSVATVTGIATQFGVWQLGRFARDYRSVFRELPSETLRRQ
jgi:AraC family transcriptional regulator, ethanolamine operon transcriptional activator